VSTFAAQERQALADALLEAGPDAPTLCEGWTAHDLAAHLVARERRSDASAGLVVPFLAGYTERVRLQYVRRPFTDLVEQFRSGPPRFSPFAIPGVDGAANLAEYFVHCEDVRRAGTTWEPRPLAPELQDRLWKMLRAQARLAFRRSPVGVVLVRPDGERVSVGADGPHVVLSGEPSELLFYSFNRTGATKVTVDGQAEALRQFRAAKLGL
jgi:uncharacterized protein (TIGR03085 family)